jgi:hypothetical protein
MDLDAEFIDRYPIFDVAIETISLHLGRRNFGECEARWSVTKTQARFTRLRDSRF